MKKELRRKEPALPAADVMSILFRNIVGYVLLSSVISTAGCSWPAVKIGNDKYLLSPQQTNKSQEGAP